MYCNAKRTAPQRPRDAVVSEAGERVFGARLAQYNDWILENQCLKTRIQPEHVAQLVLFLVSPRSAMLTGQNIALDGGRHAGCWRRIASCVERCRLRLLRLSAG
jgi:NAD(P)-dependent dehydrogenase (short-subunit alcohol dehydrogenase family)